MPRQTPLFEAHTEEAEQPIAPIPPAEDGSPPQEWLGHVHPDGYLELTRGFYLYADKMSRVLNYLAHEREEAGPIYGQLADATGMSRAQVKAYMQYATAMDLVIPRKLVVTPLGRSVLEYDTFFDRKGTLWLLHYLIASDPQRALWNYMCNAILPAVEQISKEEAAEQFLPFVGRWSESSVKKKVPKELGAFFNVYTEEFFASLDYLHETENNNVYRVNRSVMPVPPLILLATTLVFRDRFMPGASSVEIPTLAYEEHSPGRIMRQNELNIRRGLNTLHEADWLSIESKADLDQVRFGRDVGWLDAARAYWEAES